MNYCRGTGPGAGFFCGAGETPFAFPHQCSGETSRCVLPTPTVTPTRTCASATPPLCGSEEEVLCDDERCGLGCACATRTPTATPTPKTTCYPTPHCGPCLGTYCYEPNPDGCRDCFCEGSTPVPTCVPDRNCDPPFELSCHPPCGVQPCAPCECVFVARTPTPMAGMPTATPLPPACSVDCGPETVCGALHEKVPCPGGKGCACVPLPFADCNTLCGDGRPCGFNGLIVCPGGGYGDATCTGGLGSLSDECGCASRCPSPTPA